MWKLLLFLLWLAAAPAFGQVASSTLTISATRTINLKPDEATIGLWVSSSYSTGLDEVVSALSGLDITSADLTGAGSSTVPPSVQWYFTLAAPLAKLPATLGALTQLQQNIGQNDSGLTLTFGLEGSQVSQRSQQLQQTQSCSNSNLIADATAQGQKLAAAAGLTLGPILQVSDVPLPQASAGFAESSLVGFIVPALSLLGSTNATCSLVVQFQLEP